MNDKPLVFIDVETTGLDPENHDIIDVAWLVTSPDAMTVLDRYQAKMLPRRPENADPKALQVNGYTEEKWRAGPLKTGEEVAADLHAATRNRILAAQNVSFDESFLRAHLRHHGREPVWRHHKVDTMVLAWPAYSAGQLSGCSLKHLCAHFDVPQPEAHTAMGDVLSCYAVYRAMMSRYSKLF